VRMSTSPMKRSPSMLRLLPCLALVLWLPFAAEASDVATADALLKDRDPRAAQVVAALAKARPEDLAVRVLQLRLLLQDPGKSKQALAFAEDLVEDAPDYAPGHLWLGNAYANRIGQVGSFS